MVIAVTSSTAAVQGTLPAGFELAAKLQQQQTQLFKNMTAVDCSAIRHQQYE
jgi:hypothetical protein